MFSSSTQLAYIEGKTVRIKEALDRHVPTLKDESADTETACLQQTHSATCWLKLSA